MARLFLKPSFLPGTVNVTTGISLLRSNSRLPINRNGEETFHDDAGNVKTQGDSINSNQMDTTPKEITNNHSGRNGYMTDTDTNNDVALESLSVPKGPPPEPPTNCCMSGCHNCVWIDYADELVKYYSDGMAKEKVLEEIEKIEDPSLKAFLKIELS